MQLIHSSLRTLFAATAFCIACNSGRAQTLCADYHVIPLPSVIATDDAPGFTLDARVRILHTPGTTTARTAGLLASGLRLTTGFDIPVGECTPHTDPPGCIRLELADSIPVAESYRIRIGAEGLRIVAGDEEGLFRGVQTLLKSLPADCTSAEAVRFPAGEVRDAPRFAYRGIMIDVARHFFPVEFIRKTIDMLALHNLNRLHLHLTDDQGWRIEIKRYPRLTEVGAFRSDSVSGTYGGYYTQQQIRELVEYARERFVTIVPEIDMPGHVEALLTTCPELGCTGGPYAIAARPGVRRDVLCVGNPETLRCVEQILEEVLELFPSESIHIGGDEVPTDRWEVCPRCRRALRELGFAEGDGRSAARRLQGWFNGRIEEFLARHGRRLIGWDEVLDSGVSPQATVMAWRSLDKGLEALHKGHQVILTHNDRFYFDYYQSVDIESEPQAIGSCINAETVYRAQVSAPGLTEDEQARILGVQGNLWSMYVPTSSAAEYMLLPRLTALAEVAWCAPGQLDFDGFLSRMPRMQALYRQTGWNFSPHLYDITAEFTPDEEHGRILATLATGPDAAIHYTLDGSRPDRSSPRYTGPLPVDCDASLRAVAFTADSVASDLLRKEIRFNRATLRRVELQTHPAPKYAENRLTDGVRGSTIYARGGWTGFHDDDLDAVVDLGRATDVSRAGISTLIDYGSHIMDATWMEVSVSDDGTSFATVARQSYPEQPFSLRKELPVHELRFEPVRTRFVRIRAGRARQLPAQMTVPPGSRPFLFVDEIFVR